MDRIRFISHRGQRVLLEDLTDISDFEEMRRQIELDKELVASQPPKSVLVLTDVTGARYDTTLMGMMKDLAAKNEPHVKAAALVTRSATHRLATRTFALLTKQTVQAFATRDEALDWLMTKA